ncbi:MAG TPA: RsfS/YbeB/iojap family protein, partial [Candidatus Marinimicrobia bacterium]|nr:RsfS/YbeB/iojap family protein [Candidatus Neomarinimicrobiota bacterium]
LLDYVDVVVHIFLQEARDYYQLERLWADAITETIDETAAEEPEG